MLVTGMQAIAAEMEERGWTEGSWGGSQTPKPQPTVVRAPDPGCYEDENEDKEKGPEGLISRSVGLNYVLCQRVLFSFLVPSFPPQSYACRYKLKYSLLKVYMGS